MKELSKHFNFGLLYSDTSLLISHIFLICIWQNCNLYKYASCFICNCTSYGSLFKPKRLKWRKIQNRQSYCQKMHWQLCVCKPYDIFLVLVILSFQVLFTRQWNCPYWTFALFYTQLVSYIIIQNKICFICYIQV